MPGVMVRVLGPVEIERDGRLVLTRSTSRRRVLAVLVARRNTDVTLDQLTGVMDSNPAAIRTIVSRLRHDLGPDVLRTTSAGYSIDPERCDVTQVETLLADARTSRCGRALELVEEALSSWRGRAFGEFADREWAEAEAVRLDELEHSTHEDHADLLIELGRNDEAIAALKSHIVAVPLRDRPRRSLMVALHRVGRTAEALREFQDYRRFLADQVGIEPSPATVAVERMITTGESSTPQEAPRQHRNVVWPADDVDEIGLALARFVHHQGFPELAARALGACGATRAAAEETAAILDELDEVLGTWRTRQLLADGRHCARRALYRELWAAAQPLLEGSTEPGASSESE